MNDFQKQLFLFVEENKNDVLLMREAFFKAEILNPLRVVNGRDEAIAYLTGVGQYNDRFSHPLPFVLLLDFNQAGTDGFEVLAWVRGQPVLKRLVVIILTASNRGADADRAYDLGANYYLTKTGGFDELVKSMKCLYGWLKLCHFPTLIETGDQDYNQLLRGFTEGQGSVT
jgi:CheY-like chemotaxis protein